MTFDIEPDLQLLTLDRVQLQQVMVNLLRNGIEALQQAAGERLLTVRTRRQDDGVTTEVSDTGPGITAPERIFDPFFTTKSQGMGMGLAICRSIIEAHGGQLRVEANEPHGARLIFTLPLEVPNP
jgi:signal transduction histidine kinase